MKLTPQQEKVLRLRLSHANFFLTDPRAPAILRQRCGRSALLGLLYLLSGNSRLRVIGYVIGFYLENWIQNRRIDLQLFYHRRIMRRSEEETRRQVFDELFDEDLLDEEKWEEEIPTQ